MPKSINIQDKRTQYENKIGTLKLNIKGDQVWAVLEILMNSEKQEDLKNIAHLNLQSANKNKCTQTIGNTNDNGMAYDIRLTKRYKMKGMD